MGSGVGGVGGVGGRLRRRRRRLVDERVGSGAPWALFSNSREHRTWKGPGAAPQDACCQRCWAGVELRTQARRVEHRHGDASIGMRTHRMERAAAGRGACKPGAAAVRKTEREARKWTPCVPRFFAVTPPPRASRREEVLYSTWGTYGRYSHPRTLPDEEWFCIVRGEAVAVTLTPGHFPTRGGFV